MPVRLVALDEGPDIPLDRSMVVVGRHPQCDARLDSLRVSRHHCCMTQEHGEVLVRDLGSTNGIRINGQRVEFGRLRQGDELSIAHIRYRMENGQGHEATLAGGEASRVLPRDRPRESDSSPRARSEHHASLHPVNVGRHDPAAAALDTNVLAVAIRNALPPEVAKHFDIKVSPHRDPDSPGADPALAPEDQGLDPGSDGPQSPVLADPVDPRRVDSCRPD